MSPGSGSVVVELSREAKPLELEEKSVYAQHIDGFCNGLMLDQNQYMIFSAAMRIVFPGLMSHFRQKERETIEDRIKNHIHELVDGECGDISAEFVEICKSDNLVRVSQVYNFCCHLIRWAAGLSDGQ